VCYSVTALYRRYRAVTDFETRVTISIESVCCPGQSAGSRIASAQVHLYYAGEPDAYAYDESPHHAYYGEYTEGEGDADWSNDYAYTASAFSAYAVTPDPNAGGCTDSFAAFSVDTDLNLGNPLDDGSHDHMGYGAEVIKSAEPSRLLAVARCALVGSAKMFVSAAALAVAIAFSMPRGTPDKPFVVFDCLSATVLHPAYNHGTPADESDVALCGDADEHGAADDIVSECGDIDNEHDGDSATARATTSMTMTTAQARR